MALEYCKTPTSDMGMFQPQFTMESHFLVKLSSDIDDFITVLKER